MEISFIGIGQTKSCRLKLGNNSCLNEQKMVF